MGMRLLTATWRRVLVGATAAGLLMFVPTAPAMSVPIASTSHASASTHNCHSGKTLHGGNSAARSTPGGAAEPNTDAAYRHELASWRAGTLPHARITAIGGKIKVHFHVINNGSGISPRDIPPA